MLCCLFCLEIGNAHAAPAHTLKGVVITPEGTVVPEFSVVVKQISGKPELGLRKHFRKGEFVIDGLQPAKYDLQVISPLYVVSRVSVDLTDPSRPTDYSIVILHPFRNEVRMIPGAAYSVSVKVLQQKIPEAAREAYLKGVDLHREGKLESALIEYGRALRSQPFYLEALTDIGTIFLLYNRPQSALTFLRRAQNVDEHNPIINLNIAVALSEQGDQAGAAKILNRILKAEPRMAVAQLFLAKIHYSQSKLEQAENYARGALESDPKLLDASLLLTEINLARGDYEQAREGLERIRDLMNSRTVSAFIDEQLLAFGGY